MILIYTKSKVDLSRINSKLDRRQKKMMKFGRSSVAKKWPGEESLIVRQWVSQGIQTRRAVLKVKHKVKVKEQAKHHEAKVKDQAKHHKAKVKDQIKHHKVLANDGTRHHRDKGMNRVVKKWGVSQVGDQLKVKHWGEKQWITQTDWLFKGHPSVKN